MAIIIGLTGGIATGKSTVSQFFKEAKIEVIDTDIIAREVVEIGTPGYQELLEAFSDEIILPTKHINRKKLASIVFNDKIQLNRLNNIIHPYVKKEVKKRIEQFTLLNHQIIVVDVPLLFESGFESLVDFVIVVYADDDVQIQRCVNRDKISEKEAKLRIDAQMPLSQKVGLADYVIKNNYSILDTKIQFNEILDKILTKTGIKNLS